MSDVIHLLPDSVANQIAAGEVIQRPASVVKELVENAIDARAKLIKVWITDAGKTNIQIVDDGCGMSETDARLSFERHATSKISDATDLYALRTMGFRGEALASIAAVAQVELKTRTADMEVGVSLTLENSKITSHVPVACPVGSNFSVRSLFFNVPARRKFLKSDHTEFRRIVEELERVALANPNLGFELYNNEAEIIKVSPSVLKQRIVSLFGKRFDDLLLPVKVDTSLVKIAGFIVPPEAAVKKGASQYFFVNGRYMRHFYFQKAISTAYERLISDSEQPHFFIYLEVNPARIDVNVHPTKTEIKFEDEQAIWQILLAAIKETLGRFNAVPSIDFDKENMPEIPVFSANAPVSPPQVHVDTSFNPFDTTHNYEKSKVTRDWQDLYNKAQGGLSDSATSTVDSNLYSSLDEHEMNLWERGGVECIQFRRKYILTLSESGVLLIDQHRAHMRILYDSFIESIQSNKGHSQRLLFPELIELSPSQDVVFKSIEDELIALGFEFSDLGNGSYSINGMPAGLEKLSATMVMDHVLAKAKDSTANAKDDIFHRVALILAERASLSVGQHLNLLEMKQLIVQLFQSKVSTYSPDGKLILRNISFEELENLFN